MQGVAAMRIDEVRDCDRAVRDGAEVEHPEMSGEERRLDSVHGRLRIK